ncbi:MAG: hypothetical protein LAP87_10615 [Acidobacteriia bacterium]|nr:hypothetical protein [Terriglobia bacterium]
MLQQLNKALEKDKKPFAKVDDDYGAQLLAVAHLHLSLAAQDLPAGCGRCFAEMNRTLGQIQVQLPAVSYYDPDFLSALKGVATAALQGTNLPVTVEGSVGTLPRAFQASILRVAEEILRNVVKHAHAGAVTVQVCEAGEFRCSIRDDGVGFEPDDVWSGESGHGVGLLGIRERVRLLGGVLSVCSAPGKGTEVVIQLPQVDHGS